MNWRVRAIGWHPKYDFPFFLLKFASQVYEKSYILLKYCYWYRCRCHHRRLQRRWHYCCADSALFFSTWKAVVFGWCRRRRCQTHYNIIIYTNGLFQFAICCDKCELVEAISDCVCVCLYILSYAATTTTNRLHCHSFRNARARFSRSFSCSPSLSLICNALPPIIHSELFAIYFSTFFLCFVYCCCC